LKRLLRDEIKSRGKSNTTQSRKFSVMLAEAVKRYQSGLIDSATVIRELIELAQKLREDEQRGVRLGLRTDELAFYDALAENDAAQKLMGDETLSAIARELVDSVRRNTSIDWQLKESVQAKLRVLVKRILRKHHYPPDDPVTGEYRESVVRVLEQAEGMADGWDGMAPESLH
jgi:type I restriction enzyme R subunit